MEVPFTEIENKAQGYLREKYQEINGQGCLHMGEPSGPGHV